MDQNDNRQSQFRSPAQLTVANNYLGQFLVLMAACVLSLSLAFLMVVTGEQFFGTSYVEPSYFEISQDELDLRFAEVDTEIKDMANRLGFTVEAKQILYKYQPELFESGQGEGYVCGNGVEPESEITIAGCLDIPEQRIYITDGKGVENTLVHEFLHAAYQEVSFGEREELERLDQLLKEAYDDNRDELEPILALYDDLHNHSDERLNEHLLRSELHSWVGATVKDISPELEAYYGRYFKDRQVVVDVYHNDRLGF